MKKILVVFIAFFSFAVIGHAQEETSKAQWSAGFNVAPQSVYQFGNEKPEFGLGFFATTTFSTPKASVSLFYGAGNNSCGIFISRNLSRGFSVYSVAFKDLNDPGRYVGVGGTYGLGSVGDWFNACAFMELGAPFQMENSNPMVCAGIFIGFGKTLKKF